MRPLLSLCPTQFARIGYGFLVVVLLLIPRIAPASDGNVQAPFDVEAAQLPAVFGGNTVEWVLSYGVATPKTSFETEASYASRISTLSATTYAFVPDSASVFYFVSGDTVTVRLYPRITEIAQAGAPYVRAFDIHKRLLVPTTEEGPVVGLSQDRPDHGRPVVGRGRGATPRTAAITIQQWKQTQVIITESDTPLQLLSDPLAFRLTLPPKHTANANRDLGVALVCIPSAKQYESLGSKFVPEASGVYTDISKGSTSGVSRTYYVALRAELVQILVFSRQTGRIYSRFTPNGALIE